MQLSTESIKQTVVEIMTSLNQNEFVYDFQAKQLFSKLIAKLQSLKSIDKDEVNLVLRTIIEIERKTYNLNAKLMPDIWKLFIHLYFKIYHTSTSQLHNQQQTLQNVHNIQDLYNYIISFNPKNTKKLLDQTPQNLLLILTLWQKLLALSDLKTIQYVVISLAFIFIQTSSIFTFNHEQTLKLFGCIDKVSLNIIKYNQKIKDFDTFQNFSKVLHNVQNLFHLNYQKEIDKAIKHLQQCYKLTQVVGYSNIYLHTWEKIIVSHFLCLSKKKSIGGIQEAMKILNIFKKTFFFQRTINYSRIENNKGNHSTIVSHQQIEYIIYCALIQIWVNFKILYDAEIAKEQSSEQKTKLLQESQRTRNMILEIFKILTKREVKVLMARQLVKNLRITNLSTAVIQWKQVFILMHQLLKSYPVNKTTIEFKDQKSYISKSFSSHLKYPFTIVLKVKGESIPFKQQKILIQFIDSSLKEKIIITMRNYQKSCMIFSFVKVVKNNIWGKEQKEFQWFQYEANTIEIVLKSNKIKMTINNDENVFLSMQNTLVKVDEIVLCDRQEGMGSTLSQLLEFKVIQYNTFENLQKTEVDLVEFICPKYSSTSKNSMKENIKFHKCQKISQQSFISLMQIEGDLQLFMIILYHALKKLKNNQDELLHMIRFVLKLMEAFTVCKNVQLKQLTLEEKQARRKTIQCLGWFFAKQSKSVFIIFELMRFLYIRGNRNNNEILKFLCNFSYWKQFRLQKQLVIVMKIKQLLKQATKQEQRISNLGFCKQLLFDMILYFKQTGFKMADKENCLRLHQAIIQTVYDQIRDIIEVNSNNRKNKAYMLEIFGFLQYIINTISCLVNRKVHEDTLDLTLAVQLTMLLRDIGKLLFVSKERKIITKQQIDLALQNLFKKQQKNLMLPLSLNAQQACDERYSMYLTNILSQSKSLITLFDTEMTLFQQTQIKFYPLFSDTLSICTQNKIYSNIVNFGIYLSMLSEKSWNYILFAMPEEEYSQRFCQSLWRISFYQLFKQKKYFTKVCKMLEHTPLPTNEYCLMKIFEAVLFCPYFQKQHLSRIIKSSNFTKSICPFKIYQLLIKYSKKLQPENGNMKIDEEMREFDLKISLEEEKMYFVLLHAQNVDFESCQGIIQCLKTRNNFKKYKIIVYQIALRSLIRHIQIKKQHRKFQRMQTGILQSGVVETIQRHRTRLYSNDQTQINNLNEQHQPTLLDIIKREQKEDNKPSQKSQHNLIIKPQLNELVLDALQFYLNAFTIQNMKSFFGLDSTEDILALRQNFVINVEGMIKALNTHQVKKTNIQLQKYLSFIQVYLKKFSQHLISLTFVEFKSNKEINFTEKSDQNKKGRTKILYRTVYVDLIKHSTQFFLEQINQRRRQLHALQYSWSLISHRHSYFWNIFVSSQKYYSLSDITTDLGERFLLKISTDKPKIDLPKMMNKYSLAFSVSLLSDKIDNNDESEPSTLFDDCDELLMTQLEQVEAKTKDRVRKGSVHIVKEIKTRKFRVILVTNNKIYQGILFMPQRKLLRFQQTYPVDKPYDKICANEQQKRNDDEVEKQPLTFDVLLSQNSKILHRKYLFFDTAIQVFSNERSSFFCFDNEQKRDRFCTTYLKEFSVLNQEMIKKQILQQTIKWTKGLISNYQYLMKVNQYGNRSVNDLSQYYVMPWTVAEFQKTQVDRKFLNQKKHFRDLTKPLGKLFDKKWKQIENRFKMSYSRYNQQQINIPGMIQPFLYGSFYSNPAIVTNYMIRLEPFSSHHYHLQSQKIDIADRLFFQVSDQYVSLSRNIGDMKELIPEFYNNAQFLKNRSRLNLGSRQNKEIVNDVRLPKWAASAEEFIFKMRYFFESSIVSTHLNTWIDLIFGQKAKKQNAIKADNLFMSEIYGPKSKQITQRQSQTNIRLQNTQSTESAVQTQTRILFNKEFGQLPFTLFDDNHPAFNSNNDYNSFKGTIEHIFTFDNSSPKDEDVKINMCQNFCLISAGHSLELLQTGSQDYTQKQNFKLISQLCMKDQIKSCQILSGKKLGTCLPYIFYINSKQNKLLSRFIKKSKFFGSIQLKEQHLITEGNIFTWMNDQILIVALGNEIKVFSFDQCSLINLTEEDRKQFTMKIQQSKPALLMRQFPLFSQHKAKIKFIQKIDTLKLILSLDTSNKVFLLKYEPQQIRVFSNFQLRGLRFGEQVTKIMLHKLSIIVCFTSQNRLFAYTFYGELIGSKEVGFIRTQKISQEEKVNCIYLFDQNSSSQLLIGTNLGNLWKIDIFQFFKSQQPIQQKDLWFQKISLNSKQHHLEIKDINIKRYGKHWEIYVISLDKHQKKVITKVQCLTLKSIAFINTQK